MRNKFSSLRPCSCGGANGELGVNGEKPKKRKVLTKFARSGRSLRMHNTTPSQSNFSSANSRRDKNDCLLASCVNVLGSATYKILVLWSKTWKGNYFCKTIVPLDSSSVQGRLTESQLDEILSVTWSLMVMRVGDFCATICEINASSSSLSLSVSSEFLLPTAAAAAPCCFTFSTSSSSSSINDKWWSADSE